MTPLERAARALTRLTCPPGGEAQFPYVSPAEWEEKNWRHHLDAACAVLEAIREPSERMVERGALQLAEGDGVDVDLHQMTAAWRQMIDAALAEGV